ncbi:MAG: oligosaccharide flippase family protein [Clostridia bacterium]|nr:oligosaccharide flippase family protein [Clostridia bacterium]
MKNKVYANASIVTGLSVAERALGFLYRIVLSRLIGAEGLGLYQVALSLFGLFLTIGTGGLPITVSRMITKSKAENSLKGEKSAVGGGIAVCLLLTLPVAIFLALFGGKLPFLFSDERSFGVFRILLVGLCFSSVYAVIRGAFWGQKEFLAPSIMELAEETVMVIVGVMLLQSVPTATVGAEKAAWAVVISYLFSCSFSLIWFFLRGGKIGNPKGTLKPLFKTSIPITAVRASGSLVNSAIAVLLPIMLIRAGFSESDALKTFGVVSGMVLPILFVPSTLIGSLALVLVPELSEDYYRHNQERLRLNLARGLKFSFLIACFLIPFFFALGDDLGSLAYSNTEAGRMIRGGSWLLLPMSLTMISNSMLNAMGYEKQTFIFYFVGAAAMLLCILFLPALCGAYAYLLGMGASFVLTAACNIVFLFKKISVYPKLGKSLLNEYLPTLLFVPFLSLLGVFLNDGLKYCFGEIPSLLLTALLLAIATLLSALVTGAVTWKGLPLRGKKKKLPRV